MPSDRSRPPDPASDAYTGVAFQQGRVTLDRDYNALREIIDHRDQTITLDVVGACGTPDDGFAILHPLRLLTPLPLRTATLASTVAPLTNAPTAAALTTATAPAATLTTATLPTSALPTATLPITTLQGAGSLGAVSTLPILSSPPSESYNLMIRAGSMYLGGVRVEWPGASEGGAAEYGYYDQPDWLSPDPPAAPQTEMVFLQVVEHEVSATEDPNLYDVALGGPDTTQRLRLQRTVHRQAVPATSCTPAWQALQAAWQALGWSFDANTMRRLPTVRLQAAFTTSAGSTDPCDPVATGGYLGADNQLIRVKWAPTAAGSTSGTLIWGFDDASFIYRASSDQTGTRLTLTRNPPDAYHFPGAGQYVEVLRTTALLGTATSQQAEQGSTVVPRCVAEETGFVTTLAVAYDPTTSNQTLVLSHALPAAYLASGEPLFVRIWQGGAAMGPAGGTLELIDPVANATTGVTVTLTVPEGSAIAPGSFWMMALRPGTPLTVQPASLLAAPQPPDGPRSWACPLAVVEWPSSVDPVIHDCRVKFEDLIALTQRPAGCCTVSMGPGDVTIDRTLQTAIGGITGPGTLCLAPGTYPLTAPLQIGAAQAGLTIVAENGATLTAASGAEAAFGEGMIVVAGAGNVTLRGLTLIPPAAAVTPTLFTGLANLSRIALPQQSEGLAALLKLMSVQAQNLSTMIGVRAAGAPSLTVENCTVRFVPPAPAPASPILATAPLTTGATLATAASLASAAPLATAAPLTATALLATATPVASTVPLTTVGAVAPPVAATGAVTNLASLAATGVVTTAAATLTAASPTGALFGIGLLAGGACAQLAVRGCVFDASALAPTQTPGLLQSGGFIGPTGFVLHGGGPASLQGAIGCLASPYLANFLASPASPPVLNLTPTQPVPITSLITATAVATPTLTIQPAAATALAATTAPAVLTAAPRIATEAPTANLATPVTAAAPAASPALSASLTRAATVATPALATTNLTAPAAAVLATPTASAATVPTLSTVSLAGQPTLVQATTASIPAATVATTSAATLAAHTIAQPVISNLLNLSPGALNLTIDPGILQLDTADAFTTVADLSGAVFEDNIFDSVMLAISATAMLDRVRVQDNTVVSSSGGIWLRPIDEPRFTFTTTVPTPTLTVIVQDPVVAGDSMWLKLVLLQQETFLAWLLSLLLPLPSGAATPLFASPEGGTTLRVTGNTVAALGPAASGLAWGTPALAVVSATYTSAVDIGPSLLVADNRLQGRTTSAYPAAVLAISGRLSATGNLISNEPSGSPPTAISLEIFPNDDGGAGVATSITAPRIVVTGNVLEGTSNLSALLRTDAANLPAPFNTWVPFNASA